MPDEEVLSLGAVARRAEARPDDEVVRLAGSPGWSAAGLWERSMAIAGGLADLLQAGDTVATSLRSGPEAIAVTTAISALGAVEMPLGAELDQRSAQTLADSTACVMTVASGDAIRGSPYLKHLGRHARVPLVAADGPFPGAVALDKLVASVRAVKPRPRHPGDPALVMTTSGTTGRVKGA